MADPRHALGVAAEALVERWLTHAGWRVLARRCRPPGGGEVDLVAVDPRGVLVAVEVRARRTTRAGAASESLDARRLARLRRSIGLIAGNLDRRHAGLRVDLVSVEPLAGSAGRWRLVRMPLGE